ncbi:unnamed protein product [Brachionus calyciflorus]|uniref:Palmitoyltransferase n=1 Tax=Brachionus calyciflorus TaxID=104777 RepID=A0A813M767_9BILA|nr:unnamed protein product [Brachionus calyciflorus]
MFGSHGHSHDGGSCKHSHGGSSRNLGFGDEDEEKSSNPKPNPMMNPMMMAMMQQQMKNNTGNEGAMMMNPMMMMMNQAQNNPQMMDVFKRMMEHRQQMMKEFMENGGQSNPEAVKQLMTKSGEAQMKFMGELKAASAQNQNKDSLLPNPPQNFEKASDLLGGNLNSSTLDDLINKKDLNKKGKEEQEAKIMNAIERKDYSELDAVKATQYGILERVKELIESGQVDPNIPDRENVYLLHWAAINNRLDIAKYLINLGVNIDSIGGELQTSPLNWAARSGHVQMCILLMQNGADPNLYDVEGFSTIHVASMFGHSNVVAYLLVKEIDADMPDKNGATALMFAAQRIHSRDPAQLLITFNANLNAQDSKGNTALHYCVAFNNATVMDILLKKGASLNVVNKKGQTPIDLAYDRKKLNAVRFLQSYQDDVDKLPAFFKSISRNKETKKFFTRLYPFFVLYYLIFVLEMQAHWLAKIFFFGLVYGITYIFRMLFFDRWMTRYVPMAIATAFITWLYITWFIYFRPIVFEFSFYSISFLFVTTLSWYNFYKSYVTDPGSLGNNKEAKKMTIIKLVEQNEFTLDQFCSSCIIRKPIRSKHCAECDRCIAKFDHHCPWVDNCIGDGNLKYFIGFLFWTSICLVFFMDGALAYYHDTCYSSDLVEYPTMSSMRKTVQFFKCNTWVSYFSAIALFNLLWISALCVCHIYQAIYANITTNERLNFKRYKYFSDSNGNFTNPFNFGIIQNLVDLFEIKILCFKPSLINWKKEYDLHDIINSRFNKKTDKLINV